MKRGRSRRNARSAATPQSGGVILGVSRFRCTPRVAGITYAEVSGAFGRRSVTLRTYAVEEGLMQAREASIGPMAPCVKYTIPNALTTAPTACADVTFDMGDGSYERDVGWWNGGGIGALLWNPKGGYGHVLTREVQCTQRHWGKLGTGESWNCGCDGCGSGPCDATVLVCECGEDNSFRDHHYRLLRRALSLPTQKPRQVTGLRVTG